MSIQCGELTIAMAFAQSFVGALIVMGIGGFQYSPWNALMITARQRMVPRHVQARMTGV